MFPAALRTAKLVATETALRRERVSIPSVAVGDFAGGVFKRFEDKRIPLLGAGKMAAETLRSLREAGARDVMIVNRTAIRAVEPAARLGGRPSVWLYSVDYLAAACAATRRRRQQELPARLPVPGRRIRVEALVDPAFDLPVAVGIAGDIDHIHGIAVSIDDASRDRRRTPGHRLWRCRKAGEVRGEHVRANWLPSRIIRRSYPQIPLKTL